MHEELMIAMKNEVRHAVIRLNEQLEVADARTWIDDNDTIPIPPEVHDVMEDILKTVCDQEVRLYSVLYYMT